MENKVIKSSHNLDVSVNHTLFIQQNHVSVIKIHAECGSTSQSKNVTLGAVDGPRSLPSLEKLQDTLDHHRQELVEDTSWKEKVKSLVTQLK
jgi:hypothetical protein